MKATILPLLLWAGDYAECGSKWAGNRSPELNRFPSLVVGMGPVWGKLTTRGTVPRRLVKLSFRDPHFKGFLLASSKGQGGALSILLLYCYVVFL